MKYGPLIAVLGALLVGAALTHVLRPARSPQPGQAAAGEVAIAATNPGSSVGSASEPASRHLQARGGGEPDALEVERRRDAAMRREEKAFEEEPLDTAWSARQAAMVRKALSATAMAQYGAASPSSSSVECHSRTCRIVAAFPDEEQGEVGQYAIVSGIGGALASASGHALTHPDGSRTIVMYAKAVPAPAKAH